MIQTVATIITVLVVPFLVQAVKTEAMTGQMARWVAILVSLLAGVVVGLATGIPADPQAWLTCVFAMVGGTQTAYALFKQVGVTSKWLDALLAIGDTSGKHADR